MKNYGEKRVCSKLHKTKTKTRMSGPTGKYLIFVSSTQVFRGLQPLLMVLLRIPVQLSFDKSNSYFNDYECSKNNFSHKICFSCSLVFLKYSLCFELPRQQ